MSGGARRPATWRRQSRWRARLFRVWLPERVTVEYTMSALVIGFWISAIFWVPILFDQHAGP